MGENVNAEDVDDDNAKVSIPTAYANLFPWELNDEDDCLLLFIFCWDGMFDKS